LWNDGGSYRPDIVLDSLGILHVIWDDGTSGPWGTDIEVMYSNYTAGVWANATVISDNSSDWNDGSSCYSSLTVDPSNNVHAVWQEGTDGWWGPDQDIMYVNRQELVQEIRYFHHSKHSHRQKQWLHSTILT